MSFMRLNDYNVPGYGMVVGVSMDIKASDASGETSGTDEVDKGTKAKKVSVSLSIRFADENHLRQLSRVSEAKSNGSRKIYTLTNRTANAVGVRQVRFAENITFQEKDGLQAWDVSFTLKEYLSVPERVEKREKKPEAVAQTSEGTATETTAQTAEAVEEPKSMFENVLASIDKALA
ncbi:MULTISPECIES: DNA-binding protein [unclassified Pseudodesulfovibrio]|uniref:baseplate complex protein n=1 Tax=unclassified Pseudodesulfovibrio TaxID=2661612 RepID=UPI000FEBFA72|nr:MULTISPECIES: DNA-binding protein [unclassified Pseudodesulfovibrio]MCJ2164668.1 DNA-binding protein [Pseudodesulfovibrio sp. S3-i]RWU04140.1 DNA-binding protein [Pseudodesulfovibrio sp. S3]